MEPQLKSILNMIKTGHYAEALQELSNAGVGHAQTADNLYAPGLHLHEATVCFEKGQFKKAHQKVLQIYDDLLAWAPFSLEPGAVDILMTFNDTGRAQRYIERHLAYAPPDTDKLYLKALVSFRQKRYAQARNVMEEARRLAPLKAEQNLFLSECHRRCGGYDHAMRAAEAAWEQGASRADIHMMRLIFTRKGSCNSCNGLATCCLNLRLFDAHGAIRTSKQFDRYLLKDPRLKLWKHAGHDADGSWLFNCSVLSPKGKCNRHQARPRVCRDFPKDPISVSAFPHCSYRFEIRKAAPRFSLPGALDAVCKKLIEYGRRKERDALKKHLQAELDVMQPTLDAMGITPPTQARQKSVPSGSPVYGGPDSGTPPGRHGRSLYSSA